MTNTELIMLAAIDSRVPLKRNDREIVIGTDSVSVNLHGERVAELLAGRGELLLDGRTQVSRKSARVLNSLLTHYTPCSILSRDGSWYLKLKGGSTVPVSGRTVRIPVTKNCSPIKF